MDHQVEMDVEQSENKLAEEEKTRTEELVKEKDGELKEFFKI